MGNVNSSGTTAQYEHVQCTAYFSVSRQYMIKTPVEQSGKQVRAIAIYEGEDSLLILPVEQINIHTQVITRSRSKLASSKRPTLQ